jgi:large subunit ribosomal protein L7/L12
MSDTKKEETKNTSKNVEKLVDEVAKLSVLELSELVNALQEKLGVTAAMPVAAPSTVGASAATQAPTAEAGAQTAGGAATQTVTMTDAGANKIAVIKALREINQNLTLMDAKGMTEQVPAEVLKDAKAEDAKSASEKLKAAGATVELK